MKSYISSLLPNCCRGSASNDDDNLAGSYTFKKMDCRLSKIERLFDDEIKTHKVINEFTANLDDIISANAIKSEHHGSELNNFDALFSTFDLVKQQIKLENRYCCIERYSLEKNAILFFIDDVEVKHIAIQNDSGTDDVLLDGVRVDQWVFLLACYNRKLQDFDQMIDVLFPVCDLSNLASKPTAKSSLEYPNLNNCCPEKSALVLAKLQNIDCEFSLNDLDAYTSDSLAQIDIMPPLAFYASEQAGGGVFIEGKSEAAVMDYLNGLNKTVPHLLRTGANNEAGHNMILSFERGDWYLYEDVDTRYQITEKQDTNLMEKLTDRGMDIFVKPYANWGYGNQEMSICTLEATKSGTEALISYIKTCRKEGEAAAIAALDYSRYGQVPGGESYA